MWNFFCCIFARNSRKNFNCQWKNFTQKNNWSFIVFKVAEMEIEKSLKKIEISVYECFKIDVLKKIILKFKILNPKSDPLTKFMSRATFFSLAFTT